MNYITLERKKKESRELIKKYQKDSANTIKKNIDSKLKIAKLEIINKAIEKEEEEIKIIEKMQLEMIGSIK